ncbi:MAG: hypothetical protein J6Q67_06245 [Clostridia bacterium]|nr:hypothetical protein [Clostridia bacterium]
MLLVILGASIALIILAIVGYILWDWDGLAFGITVFAVCILIGCIIALIFVGVSVSELPVLDDRIAMYQEENEKIESQIAEVVAQYQKYENDIFTNVAENNEDAMFLVTLYPDLKSDTLVAKQIEIYTDNNQKIKEIKEQQIYGKVFKWWLYFGGSEG